MLVGLTDALLNLAEPSVEPFQLWTGAAAAINIIVTRVFSLCGF